jgi:hypothetical protein
MPTSKMEIAIRRWDGRQVIEVCQQIGCAGRGQTNDPKGLGEKFDLEIVILQSMGVHN